MVTSSTRSRTGLSSSASSRAVVGACTPVPVVSTSADPASSAWSRSTPPSPVRTTTWSGSAVRTASVAGSHSGLRSSRIPVAGSTEVMAYGPEETGSLP